MAIKPTRIRAISLLLLFSLISLSASAQITKVYADSPEESFKVTPLPFWEIENSNSIVEYDPYNQDVLFRNGDYFDNFFQIGDWEEWGINVATDSVTVDNSILIIEAFGNNDNDYDGVRQDLGLSGSYAYSYEIKFRQNITGAEYDLAYLTIEDTTGTVTGTENIRLDNIGGANEWLFLEDTFSYDNVDLVYIRPRVDAGEKLKFEVDYISFVKMNYVYDENFSDVSDWTSTSGIALYSDSGLGIKEHNGDMLYYSDFTNSPSFSAGYYLATRYRVNVSGSNGYRIYVYSEDSYGGEAVRVLNVAISTDWAIAVVPILQKVECIQIRYATNVVSQLEIDYIGVYSYTGIFNTSIPIERFKNHKLEFMIDTQNLTETTKLDFGIFQNDEPMNYDFSLENQTFTQRDFEFDYSEYNYLRFKLDLKYSTNYFKISCYDENNTKLFSNIIFEQVRKLGNNFKIQSDNLAKYFYLYYFTGDVDYSTIWSETIIDLDPRIDYSMLSFSSWGDTDLDDHEIIYNRFISNFQFLRTNIYLYTDFSNMLPPELGTIIDIQFYYPDGTEFYRINGKLFRTDNAFRFELKIYDNVTLIHSSAIQGLSAQEAFSTFQFAVWRTQDNRVGTFYTYDEAVFTSEPSGIPRYVTNYTLKNFQANITLIHFSEDIGLGYRNFESTLEGFELGYGRVDGVAEPHFSTTWWDSIPFLGQIINAFMIIGDAIILAMELGLSPITIFLDSIFGAIGGIAGAVWVLFESALSDLGISIDAVASDVFGFFDAILTSISGLVDDVITGITNLNDNFVAWVIDGINDALIPALVDGIEDMMDALFTLWEYQLNLVGTALGWGNVGTFLFDLTDSVVLTIPSWLSFIISINIMMVDIFVFVNALYAEYGPTFILYGCLFIAIDILTAVMTTDLDIIIECLSKYAKVIVWIAEFMLNIISMVLNAIWGILPF